MAYLDAILPFLFFLGFWLVLYGFKFTSCFAASLNLKRILYTDLNDFQKLL